MSSMFPVRLAVSDAAGRARGTPRQPASQRIYFPAGEPITAPVLWLTYCRDGSRDLRAQSGVQGIAPTWALPVRPLAGGVAEGSDSITV